MNTDRQIREIFGGDIPLPESTETRLSQVCGRIRAAESGKDLHMRKQGIKKINKRVAAIIAAAVMTAVFAGGALAYTLTHYDFVNSVWRGSDTESVSDQVDGYIAQSGATVSVLDYKITVDEYMVDELGMGYISYSLERDGGLPVARDVNHFLDVYQSGDTELLFDPDENGMTYCDPVVESSSGKTMGTLRAYVDGERSTPDKLYFTAAFTVDGLPVNEGFSIMFFVCDYSNPDNIAEYQASVTIPASAKVPCVEFGDENGSLRANVSMLGVKLSGVLSDEVDSLTICENGQEFVVDSDDYPAWKTAALYLNLDDSIDNAYYFFGKPVAPETVSSVTVNGTTLTPDFAASVPFNPTAQPDDGFIRQTEPSAP